MKEYTPLLVSLLLHVALIIYANHVDTHSHRYGGLKYTDVDWRVVTDGAGYIFRTIPGRQASGWLTNLLHMPIGDPYERATFRYTPLLPLILSPSLVHPMLGKITLSVLSLSVPIIMRSGPNPSGYKATHLLWTLNPFVLNITTRGSPEAIVLLLVVSVQYCLRQSSFPGTLHRRYWENLAAICWALSVSWKIYPIIYGVPIWAYLSQRYSLFGREVWRFGLVSLASFIGINGALWSIWGRPFLDHTFLYHLTRQDHRHNFSPYFYPIYLSFFPSANPAKATNGILSVVQGISRHPLTSFIPQFGLVTLAGWLLARRAGLDFAIFVQTVIFIIFNKVCTSQYFVWFIPLLAPVLSDLTLSRNRSIALLTAWVTGQAIWLYTAFRLEFLGEAVYLPLWAAGLVLMGASTWIIGEMLDSYRPPRSLDKRVVKRKNVITATKSP